MPKFPKLPAYSAAFIGLAASAVIVSDALAESNQNVAHGHPQQCAAILSGTPGYRDCMANYAPPETAIITRDTQLKAEPNSSSREIGVLNKGTQVALVERTANGFWFHVKSGGLEGYVSHELIDVGQSG
jgi:hypothetical protein